jgi:beta-glucosidase
MCAYNRYEGQPCCGSDPLLTDILRNRWGYDNIVVSDCGAIDDFWRKNRHETHADAATASVDAVRHSTDVECGGSYKALIEAVNKGLIKEEELNISLIRLFRGRIELGMFDPDNIVPYASTPYSIVECEEHVNYALEMAQKSMVLLKNASGTLPLSKEIKNIAVVGPNADDSTMLWANYNGFPTHTVTILEGIRNKLPEANITYVQGCNLTDNTLFNDLSGSFVSGSQKGLSVEYYNNVDFAGEPVYKGITTQFNYNADGNTQFAPNVNLTDFTARFTGEFESPISGKITVSLSADDGVRLFAGAEKVIDKWSYDGSSNRREYTFDAVKGTKYPFKIEYLQSKGGAFLEISAGYVSATEPASIAAKVKDADAIIFVGGLSPRVEGEEMPVEIPGFKRGDRTDIELPAVQRDMLKALKTTSKPVILIVCTGSALALTWENDNIDAILNAWYGGQQAGTAVADILFGDCNPSGKLPITFYKSTSQLPDFEDYNMKGRTYRYMTEEPLYHFGYGLSYSSFKVGDATLSASEITDNDNVTITVPLTNTGTFDGDEVIQVYVKNPNDPDAPLKALKGFSRVHLKAGETVKTEILLEPEAFRSFNDATQTFEVRKGTYIIMYGLSSADKDLKTIECVIAGGK